MADNLLSHRIGGMSPAGKYKLHFPTTDINQAINVGQQKFGTFILYGPTCETDGQHLRIEGDPRRRPNVIQQLRLINLVRLRGEQAVFHSSETQVTLDLNRSTGLKRIQLTHPDMNVTIIGNFAVLAYDFAPNFQSAGTWYDFFSGDSMEVVNPNAAIKLAPGQFHILTDVRVASPEPGRLAIRDVSPSGLPTEFALAQNYPNPFNPATNIQFSLPMATPVSLVVYDILGREVAILLDWRVEPGHQQVTWNGRDTAGREAPSGIYLHRMIMPKFRATIKMLLLK